MLLAAGRILEVSASANMGEASLQARREQIDTMKHGRREAAKALLWLVANYTETADKLLDRIARTRGHEYVGGGFEYSVYRPIGEDTVVKVNRASAMMSDNDRAKLAEERRHDHQLLRTFLGDTVIGQDMAVREHVLGGYQTLQLTQPYVPCTEKDSPFVKDSPRIDIERLAEITETVPGSDAAYSELVGAGRAMFGRSSEIPDTNGRNNFATQPDGSLLLVDTTPVGTEHAGVQALILKQLDSLESGLREVA